MLDTFIYSALAFAFIALFVVGCLIAKRIGWIDIGNVLLLVIAALFYDNGIQAIGKYMGESTLLQSLNWFRYLFHALITPLLILFAWRTLMNTDLKWIKKSVVLWMTIILTISLIGLELMTSVWGMTLEPTWKNGVLSYSKVEHSGISSVMIIIVMIVLLVSSIIVWWKQKWAVYFLGVLSMGSTPLFNYILKTEAAHNIAELLLISALLATQYHQQKKNR